MRTVARKCIVCIVSIVLFCSSSALCEPDLVLSDYVVPDSVSTESIEDFYGVWKCSYVVIEDNVITYESYAEYSRFLNEPMIIGNAEYSTSQMSDDYYIMIDGQHAAVVCGDIYSVESFDDYSFAHGRLISLSEDGTQETTEILTDGNMCTSGKSEGIDFKVIFYREETMSSFLKSGIIKIDTTKVADSNKQDSKSASASSSGSSGTNIGINQKTEPEMSSEETSESAPAQVAYELPEDADRTVKITNTDLTVAIGGKKLKLTTEITALKEEAPAKSVLVWSSDDTSIAKVDANGNVTGVKQGTAVITCALKDRPEIKTGITVTVVRVVTGVKLSDKNLTIAKGKTAQVTATITPKDATNQEVEWNSSDKNVATVSNDGSVKAVNGGDCEITCTTKDGGITASVKIHVPTFSVNKTEYTVTSKNGYVIPVNWDSFGASLMLTDNGGSYFDADWQNYDIKIVPKKAGKGSIVLQNENAPKDKVTIKITIEHSAVYDNQSYPAIQYDNAMRYPTNYKGDKVSFSGKVLQVMNGSKTTTYRISSRGRYDNVVYVTIDNKDIMTPVIDDDNVTVYGVYNGNETYTSIWGQSITIPHVKAERIIVK